MNTTSIAGYTFTARSTSTASVIDALRHRCGAKLSTPHWMIFDAGRCSNSRLNSASSSSEYWGRLASGLGPGSCGALRLARLRDIRTGLVVIHVVLRGDVGQRELIELLEIGGDR